MATAVKSYRADNKGRIAFPSLAGEIVLVEQISATEFRVRKAQLIAADELPFHEQSLQPLSDRDRDLFLSTMDNPPEPNQAILDAAERYKARRG